MFESFPKAKLKIISSAGKERGEVEGIVADKKIIVQDIKAIIEPGDEIRRPIPNGTEETFVVDDTRYYEGGHSIPAHFQLSVSRRGAFQAGRGGNYNINVSGPNARVNINSTDKSRNSVEQRAVFDELRRAIQEGVEGPSKNLILEKVNATESSLGNDDAYRKAYQDLIQSAANHITILAPFLPALSQLLG